MKHSFLYCGAVAVICMFSADSLVVAGELMMQWRFCPEEMAVQEDAAWVQTARFFKYRRSVTEPEIVTDGMRGEGSGALRLAENARIITGEPFELPDSWTLSFWIKDERPLGEIPKKFYPESLVSIEARLLCLNDPWYFRLDPENKGTAKGWHEGKDDGGWDEIEVPAWWSRHIGQMVGYAWYKTRFHVPEEFADMEHELHFEGVDEQAWVYVNGEFVGEQTEESTGEGIGVLWTAPFSVTIAPRILKGGEDNLLVVRCHASEGSGGIFRPVDFIPTGENRHVMDMSPLSAPRAAAGGWEHVAIVSGPKGARLYTNGKPADSGAAPLWRHDLRRVMLSFAGGDNDGFTGLLDEVQFFEGALSASDIASLSIYRPDAGWIREHSNEMQRLIQTATLSEDEAAKLVSLGAPDAAALLKTFGKSERMEERLAAVRALGVLGNYDAVSALIKELDPDAAEMTGAIQEALLRLHLEGVYPDALIEHRAEKSASMLESVLRKTDNAALQRISVDALRGIKDDYEVVKDLIGYLDSDADGLVAMAIECLRHLAEENVYPGALVKKGGRESASLIGKVLAKTSDTSLWHAGAGGLREIAGDYEAVVLMIGRFAREAGKFAGAADEVLGDLTEKGIYPGVLVERGDEKSVSLLETVLVCSSGLTPVCASIDGLRSLVPDYGEIDVLRGVLRDKRLDEDVRAAAIERFPETEHLALVLLEIIKDREERPHVRAAAIETITAAGPESRRMLSDDPDASEVVERHERESGMLADIVERTMRFREKTGGRGRQYSMAMKRAFMEKVAESPYVTPTASADENFVMGKTSGWSGVPKIPVHDIYGFLLTDPDADGPKSRVVLTDGNHTEYPGSWTFHGMLEFLLSDYPEAKTMRNIAEFYVYPMVNPDGRYTGSRVRNPEVEHAGWNNHNRVWNTAGLFSTIDTLVPALRFDTRGRVDYMIDFHCGFTPSALLTFDDLVDSAFAVAITERTGKRIVGRSPPGIVRSTSNFALSEYGLNSPRSYITEPSDNQPNEVGAEHGFHYALAMHDMLTGRHDDSNDFTSVP